ncbi:peptidase [Cupriavidus necator]|uniref:A24 family peptidase n=1 Tax=Cupriavidus TaxID=106589 RepID=UPI00032E1630|nr:MULTISPECIES: prepilin peptidase [Cupriavidus]EON20930.1 flp pilus assembly protein, protease CpaA [Cupriavidus sp. GA3-3]KUE85447.1 peptidase [Cupriavidus necator]
MIAALLCAATLYTDFLHRRVPNALLAAAVLALGLSLLAGQGMELPLTTRLIGAGLGLAVTLPVYALGQMAAGDVKFLVVAGLFTGPQGLVAAWVVGNLLGLVHALLAIALGGRAPATSQAIDHQDSGPIPTAQFSRARGIPYAAYLAVGVLAWMAAGH